MILNRKIELDCKEVIGIEDILNFGQVEITDIDVIKDGLIRWATNKLQEAFDFGYSEGRKSNE